MIHPVLFLLAFYVLFRTIMSVRVENYASFVFVGIVAWTWVQGTLMVAASAISSNAQLVGQPGFPVAILPVATVLSSFVNFLVIFPFLFLIVVLEVGFPGLPIFALPAIMLCQFLLLLAFSFFLASVNVTFRDVEHFLPLLLQLGYFLSPIFYDAAILPDNVRTYLLANPMVHILGAYRRVLIDGLWPDWSALLVLCAISGVLVWVGYRYFEKSRLRFLEEI